MEDKNKQKIINIRLVDYSVIAISLILAAVINLYFYPVKKAHYLDKTVSDAVVLSDSGKQDEAIKILETITKDDPKNEEAKTRLAMAYYQTKDYEQFLNFVEKNKLESPSIYSMMAGIYENRGDKNKAEEYYNLAISKYPENAKVFVTFAGYYQSTGQYDLAISILEKGLSGAPKSTSLLISTASIYLKSKNQAKAIEFANRVLDISPNNQQAKTILNKARQL